MKDIFYYIYIYIQKNENFLDFYLKQKNNVCVCVAYTHFS